MASLVGEWVFCSALYANPPARWRRYLTDVLGGLPADDRELARRAQSLAGDFVDKLGDSIPWADYDLVGFTSSGDQNIASLALARRAKAKNRDITVVFGGPNWRGSMGAALLARFRSWTRRLLGKPISPCRPLWQPWSRAEQAVLACRGWTSAPQRAWSNALRKPR